MPSNKHLEHSITQIVKPPQSPHIFIIQGRQTFIIQESIFSVNFHLNLTIINVRNMLV